MEIIAQSLTNYCIKNHIAESEEYEWLLYCIEKKLISITGMLTMTVLSAFLSCPTAALCYLFSFQLLRSYTSGFHAKTPARCLALSAVMATAFFLGLYPRLSFVPILICNFGSTASILLLAPYNHPNMQLSLAEIRALRFRARLSAVAVALASLCLWQIGLTTYAKGLCIGLSMTGFSLLLAYFKDWRKQK